MAKDHLEMDEKFKVIEGIISPVSDGYGKSSLISAEHRIKMCQLACEGSDFIRVDPWEASLSTWTRTIDVLKHLDESVNSRPDSKGQVILMLLAGSDLVEGFANETVWPPSGVRAIIENFGLVVVERDSSHSIQSFIKQSPTLTSLQDKIHIIKQPIFSEMSSSKLRELIKSGRSIKYLTPDSVVQYIKENNLYC